MKQNPIIIAGAVDTELDVLIEKINNVEKVEENGYVFYEGSVNDYPVVIVKTGVGTINATIAIMAAINKYNPIAIVNEGTAGSHTLDLKKGDLIIGEEMVYINSFKTYPKPVGEGSHPFDWRMTDFQHNLDNDCTIYKADNSLISCAEEVQDLYSFGNVYKARIGSGDVFNREADRINWICQTLETSCEEMEGIAVYVTAKRLNVPVIGFRVISNNELLGEGYDTRYGKYSQEYAYNFIKKYIDTL